MTCKLVVQYESCLSLALHVSDVGKLVASAQPGGFKEKPWRQTHAYIPRGQEPRRGAGANALL